MKLRDLRILLLICFLVWIASSHLGSWFRPLAGSSLLEWWLPLASAILLPTGLMFSLVALASWPESRHDTGWVTLGYLTMYAVFLGTLLTSVVLSQSLAGISKNISSQSVLPALLRTLYSTPPKKDLQMAAGMIYTKSGARVPYLTEDNTYRLYEPTPEEEERWEKNQNLEKDRKQRIANSKSRSRRPLNLLTFSIGSFILIFLIGTLRLMSKKAIAAP